MKNTIRKEKKAKPEKKKNKVFSRTVHALLSGEFLTKDGVVKHMPYLLFLTTLFIIYISVGYFFENTLRDNQRYQHELDEQRSEYNTTLSEFETKKQQSHVARDIQSLGLEESVTQPQIIEVRPDYFEE